MVLRVRVDHLGVHIAFVNVCPQPSVPTIDWHAACGLFAVIVFSLACVVQNCVPELLRSALLCVVWLFVLLLPHHVPSDTIKCFSTHFPLHFLMMLNRLTAPHMHVSVNNMQVVNSRPCVSSTQLIINASSIWLTLRFTLDREDLYR